MHVWKEKDWKFCRENDITDCEFCGLTFTEEDVQDGIYGIAEGKNNIIYYICYFCLRKIAPNVKI